MKTTDKLIEQRIVTKVNEKTDWISSMVVVKMPQSNKYRICIDPRDLNQVLQRPRYSQPTIEDILLELSKANKFFSAWCKRRILASKTRRRKLLLNNILVPLWYIEVVRNTIWNQHSTRRISKRTNWACFRSSRCGWDR